MKMTKKSLILALLLGLWALLHSAFQHSQSNPRQSLRERHLQAIGQFVQSCEQLQKQAKELDSQEDWEAFRQKLIQTRLAYKDIQMLLEYLQPEDAKDHFNGAPLAKAERNAPSLTILAPKGLQRLEELAYDSEAEAREIRLLSEELYRQSRLLQLFAPQDKFSDRQIFEAMRLELVRIMALGLTGFDTPVRSDRAILESTRAWQRLRETFALYAQADSLSGKISQRLAAAEKYLQGNPDFEGFNRAYFIREYLEPTYRDLGLFHRAKAWETWREALHTEFSINYDAPHIFSSDFFNPYAFSALTRSDNREELRQLGRLLFYEPALSANFQASCASCHHSDKAFSDGLITSLATHNNPDKKRHIQRNAPGLINAMISRGFFYDLRADRMESQIEHVIFNEDEFGANYQQIFRRLESSSEYQGLFARAFPQSAPGIDRSKLSLAISAYLQSQHSYDSPVDRYLRGEAEAQLAPKVIEGFNLFMGKAACGTCHFAPSFAGLVPPLFEEHETEVLGVLKSPLLRELDPDLGRLASQKLSDEHPLYQHAFKTVSVRNVAYTAPYFHNGAYPTLASVLEFYNHGGAQGLGLELDNQTLPADSLHLSTAESEAIIAFMESLSDTSVWLAPPDRLPHIDGCSPEQRRVGGSL